MAAMRNVMLQFKSLQAQVSVMKATNDDNHTGFNQTHKCSGPAAPEGTVPVTSLYPLKQHMVCTGCGADVATADITKAFQPTKGRYMEVTAAELESVRVSTSGVIVIEQVVSLAHALEDPTWFDGSSYFLVPPTKEKYPPMAYAAILAILQGDCAIGRTTAYGKEYTVLLRATANGLVMHHMRYPGEIRPVPSVSLPVIDEGQLNIIRQIKETMRAERPNLNYRDSYSEAKAKMLADKVDGTLSLIPMTEVALVPTVDITAGLNAILAAAKPVTAVSVEPDVKAVKTEKKNKRTKRVA